MVSEKDIPNPVNIYGKSKLIGENYITKNIKKHCIIRTTPVGINLNPSKEKFVEVFRDQTFMIKIDYWFEK